MECSVMRWRSWALPSCSRRHGFPSYAAEVDLIRRADVGSLDMGPISPLHMPQISRAIGGESRCAGDTKAEEGQRIIAMRWKSPSSSHEQIGIRGGGGAASPSRSLWACSWPSSYRCMAMGKPSVDRYAKSVWTSVLGQRLISCASTMAPQSG